MARPCIDDDLSVMLRDDATSSPPEADEFAAVAGADTSAASPDKCNARESSQSATQRVQVLTREHVTPGPSPVDEFIAERRTEAALE